MGLFDRLKSGLGKTRGGFTGKITSLLTGRKIDEDLFDELEEALAAVYDGRFHFEDRMIMTLKDEEGVHFALNEIVISRNKPAAGVLSVEISAVQRPGESSESKAV